MSEITPFTHWPHNVRIFFPEIYERDRRLPAADAFKSEYPEVIARFPKNSAASALMDYISENQIAPC